MLSSCRPKKLLFQLILRSEEGKLFFYDAEEMMRQMGGLGGASGGPGAAEMGDLRLDMG
jgi:hypothetical protein